jgi:hypothetical protein
VLQDTRGASRVTVTCRLSCPHMRSNPAWYQNQGLLLAMTQPCLTHILTPVHEVFSDPALLQTGHVMHQSTTECMSLLFPMLCQSRLVARRHMPGERYGLCKHYPLHAMQQCAEMAGPTHLH